MKRIAYLGIPGSFSFFAGKKYFGNKVEMIDNMTIKNVFTNLIKGSADYGVVPVENSTTGSILETYDQLMESNMTICGEVRLKIHHNLMVTKQNTDISEIKKCYSHPQAISQCESFFENHDWIKPVLTTDTATAAKFISENNRKDEAAIASHDTAKIYNLDILKKNIEKNMNNFTRFIIIGSKNNNVGNKASVVFSVKHIPGSLFHALRPYAGLGLNLMKIESRPLFGKAWEYIFFADFEIKNNLDKFHLMIKEMKESTEFITVLGIYNKGETYET